MRVAEKEAEEAEKKLKKLKEKERKEEKKEKVEEIEKREEIEKIETAIAREATVPILRPLEEEVREEARRIGAERREKKEEKEERKVKYTGKIAEYEKMAEKISAEIIPLDDLRRLRTFIHKTPFEKEERIRTEIQLPGEEKKEIIKYLEAAHPSELAEIERGAPSLRELKKYRRRH